MAQVWKNKLYYREEQMSQEIKPIPTFWIRCKHYNDKNTLEELAKENRGNENSRISPEEFLGEVGCATAYFPCCLMWENKTMLLILKKSKVKGLQVRVYCCEKIPIKGTNLSRKLQEALIVI